jgi:hypothetical protein
MGPYHKTIIAVCQVTWPDTAGQAGQAYDLFVGD